MLRRLFELLRYWLKPTSERAVMEIIIASSYLNEKDILEMAQYLVAYDNLIARTKDSECLVDVVNH